MADNVAITAGSGTTVATDDIAGVHYQKVKPVFGADDTATAPSTNTGALDAGTQRVTLPTDQPKIPIHGSVAHDGVDADSPVKIGGKAISSETAVVAAGDRTNFVGDLTGKQIILPYANPENFTSGATSAITTTTSTSVIAAAGVGVRLYITSIIVVNTSATNTYVNIQDENGPTTLMVVPAPATSGAVIQLPVPIKTTANKGIFAATGAGVTSVYVTAVGYKGV